jgi:KilA-N domain
MKTVLFKKSKIRVDEQGRVCLNDIHVAAGFTKNQTPNDWIASGNVKSQINSLIKRNTGKSGIWTKEEINAVYHSKRGNGGGTWADENLALGYAAYLSPVLAVEIREVFLRYKKADPRLADEVLQRTTPDANEWVARRALGRVVRNQFTQELDKRGVGLGWQFGDVTNETYKGLFDKTAKQLKETKGVSKTGNLRDKMSIKEIVFVAASEALSIERMEDESSDGYADCKMATAKAAKSLRSAIDSDRKSRQKSLI